MAVGRAPKNTVLAGMFVLACIVLAVVAIVMLANIGERLTPKSTYVVRFGMLDGAEGLDKGSAVKLAGKRVGRVVQARFTPSEGEPEFVDVTIEIDSSIRLFQDADLQLIKPLLGSGSTINISAGLAAAPMFQEAPGPAQPLRHGDMIMGRLGGPGFIAPSDYARIQSIIRRVDQIVVDVQPRVGGIMSDAQAAISDVREIVASARESWPTWRESLSTILTRVETESKGLEGVGERISRGVQDGEDLLQRARKFVDENQPKFDEIVENVRELTVKVNKEAYDKVLAVLTDARATLESARSAATQVDQLLTEKIPDLKDLIASAAIAGQQLKLATTEIRASPWRLLYQPTKKELENELLYNSVRQYANSVTELRSAAETLKAVTDKADAAGGAGGAGGAAGVDAATLERLTAKLRTAFDQYQEQERAFLERWVKTDR